MISGSGGNWAGSKLSVTVGAAGLGAILVVGASGVGTVCAKAGRGMIGAAVASAVATSMVAIVDRRIVGLLVGPAGPAATIIVSPWVPQARSALPAGCRCLP